MKRLFGWLMLLVSLAAIAVGCTSGEEDALELPKGPALVMFYTDG